MLVDKIYNEYFSKSCKMRLIIINISKYVINKLTFLIIKEERIIIRNVYLIIIIYIMMYY